MCLSFWLVFGGDYLGRFGLDWKGWGLSVFLFLFFFLIYWDLLVGCLVLLLRYVFKSLNIIVVISMGIKFIWFLFVGVWDCSFCLGVIFLDYSGFGWLGIGI